MAFLALLRPFWPVIWRALAGIAIALTLWWAWAHFVKAPYIAEGVAQERVHTIAAERRAQAAEEANALLSDDVTRMRAAIDTANKALADAKADEAARVAASNALLTSLRAREKALLAEIADLYAVAHGSPAATPEEACLEADRILSDLAAHRVRK